MHHHLPKDLDSKSRYFPSFLSFLHSIHLIHQQVLLTLKEKPKSLSSLNLHYRYPILNHYHPSNIFMRM